MAKPMQMDDDTPREIGQIDAELRGIIRGLVIGSLPWPLFLTGAPGRGKSAAALCLCDLVRDSFYFRFTKFLKCLEWARQKEVSLLRWRETGPDMPSKLTNVSFNEANLYTTLKNAPLVCIDDLATRGGYTEPQYDLFYDLVEDRKLKPLIIVSNLSLQQLGEVFDDRILSRLARGTIFTLAGRDRRLDEKRGR